MPLSFQHSQLKSWGFRLWLGRTRS